MTVSERESEREKRRVKVMGQYFVIEKQFHHIRSLTMSSITIPTRCSMCSIS